MAPEYLPNKEVERLAIRTVRHYEKRRRGLRSVRTIRRAAKKSGYDLVSGVRRIEVKGTQGQRVHQQLYISSQAERNSLQSGGWLYRVTGVGSRQPQVHELAGDKLRFVPEKRWRVTRNKK